MSYLQKRKREADDLPEPHWMTRHRADDEFGSEQSFCIEVHEADLIHGKESLALTLEALHCDAQSESSNKSPDTHGSSLLKWYEDISENDIWVDRFDARLLLSELPAFCSAQPEPAADPGSPVSSSGWSDLPSDTEDAFFLSPSEVADLRYTKRRHMLEDARTERLAALRAVEGDSSAPEEEDVWGGSDEEPDEARMLLMERTATHLYASPDRTRLAARILANHGADKRFAFMRGRWHRAWIRAQAKAAAAAAATREEEKKQNTNGPGLVGLTAYGDSDEEESDAGEDSETLEKDRADEATKMEARRARAREWAAKRRAERDDPNSLSNQ